MNPDAEKNSADQVEAESEMPAEIPVLIAGGGPIGLSMSILLSTLGVRSLLVEQHPGTSIYPKARFVNARTMEIFRQCGLERSVREIAMPTSEARNALWVRSLAGDEIFRLTIETVTPEAVEKWSPTCGLTTSQEALEPVLLARARELKPGQVRFGTQLTDFEPHESHVSATLLHRPSGRVQQVQAQYLIGADGAHSFVRGRLGIHRQGSELNAHLMNIAFRADLKPWIRGRSINICNIVQREAPGVLMPVAGAKQWAFQCFYRPDVGQRPEDFTPEHCIQLIRSAVGVPELEVEILRVTAWDPTALVADCFSRERVFLAGDAAHEMTPAGGFNMNVGIQDAHNLAWKLAAVLQKWAEPALLATYDDERRPVGQLTSEVTHRNLASVVRAVTQSASQNTPASTDLAGPSFFREHGLVFGVTYVSHAICPDGTSPATLANPVSDYVPGARPGSRAPHVWLKRDGERLSTIDLFGQSFVLLAGTKGQPWRNAAKDAAQALGMPLQTVQVGEGGAVHDPNHDWAAMYGVEADGALLIRPDGHVAWRRSTAHGEPFAELKTALRNIIGEQVGERRAA